MGKLIYATNTSLDGFTEDANGSFDWSAPDDEVHEFYNDMVRGVGIQLLGRRMYETMAVWETEPSFFEDSAVLADFAAAWQDSDKLVYSTTLSAPVTNRTRIVSAFEADEVRVLKEASPADLLVGGPGLAALALRSAKVRVLASCVPSPRFVSPAQWPFHQTIERCHPLLLGERLDEDPSSEDGADLGKEEFRYPKSRVDRQPFAECSARCGERRSRRQRRRQRLPGWSQIAVIPNQAEFISGGRFRVDGFSFVEVVEPRRQSFGSHVVVVDDESNNGIAMETFSAVGHPAKVLDRHLHAPGLASRNSLVTCGAAQVPTENKPSTEAQSGPAPGSATRSLLGGRGACRCASHVVSRRRRRRRRSLSRSLTILRIRASSPSKALRTRR